MVTWQFHLFMEVRIPDLTGCMLLSIRDLLNPPDTARHSVFSVGGQLCSPISEWSAYHKAYLQQDTWKTRQCRVRGRRHR
ncbi:hypothetical protein AB205_0170050, partial [Aquarana catesbeiana]